MYRNCTLKRGQILIPISFPKFSPETLGGQKKSKNSLAEDVDFLTEAVQKREILGGTLENTNGGAAFDFLCSKNEKIST